jgi:hypothetical protein
MDFLVAPDMKDLLRIHPALWAVIKQQSPFEERSLFRAHPVATRLATPQITFPMIHNKIDIVPAKPASISSEFYFDFMRRILGISVSQD